MRRAEGTPSSRRLALIPVIQVGGAGVGLCAWYLLSAVADPSYQEIPVRTYAVSSVLTLALTLGIPYVLPNLYRAIDPATLSGTGPWSGPLRLFVAVNGAVSLTSSALVWIAILSGTGWSKTLVSWILAMSVATTSAVCIEIGQMGRATGSLRLSARALLGNLILPVCWLLGTFLKTSESAVVLVTSGTSLMVFWLGVHGMRGRIRPIRRDRALVAASLDTRRVVLLAAPLVPHLLAFSAILQFPRLIAGEFGTPDQLAMVHSWMLNFNTVATLAAAANSLLVVRIQIDAKPLDVSAFRKVLCAYSAMGLVLALVLVLLALIQVSLLGIVYSGPKSDLFLMGLCPFLLCMYYGTSSSNMRENRTRAVLASSVVAVSSTVLLHLALYASGIGELAIVKPVVFMCSLLILAGVSGVLVKKQLQSAMLGYWISVAAIGLIGTGAILGGR